MQKQQLLERHSWQGPRVWRVTVFNQASQNIKTDAGWMESGVASLLIVSVFPSPILCSLGPAESPHLPSCSWSIHPSALLPINQPYKPTWSICMQHSSTSWALQTPMLSWQNHALNRREGSTQDKDSHELKHARTSQLSSNHPHYCWSNTTVIFVRNTWERPKPFPFWHSGHGVHSSAPL